MAWRAPIISAPLAILAPYEVFLDSDGNPIIIQLKPREIIHFVFNLITELATDTGDWQVLGGHKIISGGVLPQVAESTTQMGLAAADFAAPADVDDYYNGCMFIVTNGDNESGDLRMIVEYDASGGAQSGLITLAAALGGTPASGELYDVYRVAPILNGSGSIIGTTTMDEADPQWDEFGASGYEFLIPRAKRSGSTDAHSMILTYAIDGVDA